MKKEELTIGNYVYVAHQHSNMGGDYDLEFIPEKLTLEHFKFWAENDWNNTDFDEFLKPIPLTPEILENNGFEYINDEYGCWLMSKIELRERVPHNCLFEVEIRISEKTIFLHYVHELQHILRLCMIEKEIKP